VAGSRRDLRHLGVGRVCGSARRAKNTTVNIRKVIQQRIRHHAEGVDLVGDINAVVAANVNEPGSVNRVSSSSSHRVVQQSARKRTKEDT
jgi:hypothetical protein